MNESDTIRAALDSPEFKQRFRDHLVEEARQTNTALHYIDAEGRYVEECPATGALYEVRYDKETDQSIRIRTLRHPEPVLS
jgi:hypothetical protein